ncbi:MAG: SDR family oxidoreductase [Gammaproteobacteria bacterium]|nr:SDR family oxidoreductase [Gammaproteobacteria bacterium]
MSTVLITGANRGIGLELVKFYAARGDRVLACCRDPKSATALSKVGGDVTVHALTVNDAAAVAALAQALAGETIDILINNAGVLGPAYERQTAWEMDFDAWAEAFDVNAIAPVRVMHALLPNLRQSANPKLVNITSQMGAISLDMTMGFGYSATKAALNKFMKLAAIELGREGINSCLIHPGWVQTDMGGPQADITPAESAAGIVATVDKLDAASNGSFWKWNGEVHDW